MKYCLGTVQFGLNYGIQNNNKLDLDSIFSIIDEAINNDIKCFDTALGYGEAEKVLGQYIASRNIQKNDIKIITKEKSQPNYEFLSKNIESSIKRIHVGILYGFLYHDSTVVNSKARMEMLYKVKATGLAKKIGVSIYTPEEALKALEYKIDIIQVPYNLFDSRLDKVHFFEKAKEKNIEIYARSSLLQGLALMNSDELPKSVSFAKDYLDIFNKLCKKYNVDKLSVAINYVASNKNIDYIVFGTDNISQFREYIAVKNILLSKELITEIKDTFKEVPEKLINPTLWK